MRLLKALSQHGGHHVPARGKFAEVRPLALLGSAALTLIAASFRIRSPVNVVNFVQQVPTLTRCCLVQALRWISRSTIWPVRPFKNILGSIIWTWTCCPPVLMWRHWYVNVGCRQIQLFMFFQENLVASIARNNILRPYNADDRLIMEKLGLGLEPQCDSDDLACPQNYSTTQREYIFALFLLRYRVLDVGIWLWRHTESKTPGDIIRTTLPETQSIVSSKITMFCCE